MYASEDCGTRVSKYLEYGIGVCGVCNTLTQVANPYDFGWPTFYTYKNGAPVKG